VIGNHKFTFIEELKMTRAEEYDYDKFLSDSSDDYPKYEDLIKKDNPVKYSQSDDYWFYADKFNCTGNAVDFSGTNIGLAQSDKNIIIADGIADGIHLYKK
jgi:glutamine cyclotransferase